MRSGEDSIFHADGRVCAKGPEAGGKEHGNVRNEECGCSLVKERMRGNEARKVCRGWIIQDSQATRISSNFLF